MTLRLLAGSPDAVALEAPLKNKKRSEKTERKGKTSALMTEHEISLLVHAPTFSYCIKRWAAADISHLSGCTLCSVHWGTFFGFAKVLVVRMAAPQLLAGVVRPKLDEQTEFFVRLDKQTSFCSHHQLNVCQEQKKFSVAQHAMRSFTVSRGDDQHLYIWRLWRTYCSAHLITNAKIKAALLVHWIIDSRKLRKLGPLVFKGIIQQAIVGAEEQME